MRLPPAAADFVAGLSISPTAFARADAAREEARRLRASRVKELRTLERLGASSPEIRKAIAAAEKARAALEAAREALRAATIRAEQAELAAGNAVKAQSARAEELRRALADEAPAIVAFLTAIRTARERVRLGTAKVPAGYRCAKDFVVAADRARDRFEGMLHAEVPEDLQAQLDGVGLDLGLAEMSL